MKNKRPPKKLKVVRKKVHSLRNVFMLENTFSEFTIIYIFLTLSIKPSYGINNYLHNINFNIISIFH